MSIAFHKDEENQENSLLKQQWKLLFFPSLDYQEAWDLQKKLVDLRRQEKIPDTLILLEHPAVITQGRASENGEVLISDVELAKRNIPVIKTDRGGNTTLHAPGQLVGYFIVALYNRERKIRSLINKIENSLINCLKFYGIEGEQKENYPGIWVRDKKIASLGIAIHKGVTSHGFALNVAPDMSLFRLIVPCGIQNVTMSSIEKLTGRSVSITEVIEVYQRSIQSELGIVLKA